MNNGEKLLYQNNNLAYNLIIGFILINTIVMIIVLKSMTINIRVGSFILFNIILSLISFLLSIKVKKYSVNWAIFGICIGALQSVRSFTLPQLPNEGTNKLLVTLSIISSVLAITGGIVTIIKGKLRNRFLLQRNR